MQLSDQQSKFVESDAQSVILVGGRQSGKTTALAHKGVADITNGNTAHLFSHRYSRACNILNMIAEIMSNKSISYSRPSMDVIKYGSQTIEAIDAQSDMRDITNLSDTILIDEAGYLDIDEMYHYCESYGVNLYAVTTPQNGDIFDYDFDKYVHMPTSSNPEINQRAFDRLDSMSNTKLLETTIDSEHMIDFTRERVDGDMIFCGECCACGWLYEINVSDIDKQKHYLAELGVLSMASNTDCPKTI